MQKAWEIAREGARKFGGKVSEYFAEALRMAWAIVKNGMEKYVKQVKGTIEPVQASELAGSEKQIAWAKEIRQNAVNVLLNEVMHEEYTMETTRSQKVAKRPVHAVLEALKTEEGINEYFEERKDSPAFILNNAVKTLNSAYDRYQRFAEIATNDSAKFWIDNRDNQEKNYMFKNFIEYVNNGVKNF